MTSVATAPQLFTPFKLRSLELANRIVVSPMCQYSASEGSPTDWHHVHLGNLSMSGAALVRIDEVGVPATRRVVADHSAASRTRRKAQVVNAGRAKVS